MALFRPAHHNTYRTITGNAATLIDHIWSISVERLNSEVSGAGTSDHQRTFALVSFHILSKLINRIFTDDSDECIDELEKSLIDNNFLSNASWEDCGNWDQIFFLVFQAFYKTYDKCCPIKSKFLNIQRLRKPWLTPDDMFVIQSLHELNEIYRPGTISYNSYRLTFDKVSNRVRMA